MKKSLYVLMLALFALILAACGDGNTEEEKSEENKESGKEATVTVKHELDEQEVEVLKDPKRVVVFDYSSLDILDTFGVEVAGLPKDGLPSYLDKYNADSYENVGSLKEPDFDKIDKIHPELIIISESQQDKYEQFKEIAPTIYLGIDNADYMNSVMKNATALAEIFGKEDTAKEELEKINEKMEAVKGKAEEGKKGLIVMNNGGKLSAFGPGSRFGIIHDAFGVEAADTTLKGDTSGKEISSEYIAEKNPDYLFVINRDAAVNDSEGGKESIENTAVEKTEAARNGKIIYLDADYWYLSGGGIQSVSKMADEISNGLEQ